MLDSFHNAPVLSLCCVCINIRQRTVNILRNLCHEPYEKLPSQRYGCVAPKPFSCQSGIHSSSVCGARTHTEREREGSPLKVSFVLLLCVSDRKIRHGGLCVCVWIFCARRCSDFLTKSRLAHQSDLLRQLPFFRKVNFSLLSLWIVEISLSCLLGSHLNFWQ